MFRTLRWEDYLGLPEWVRANRMNPEKERIFWQEAEREVAEREDSRDAAEGESGSKSEKEPRRHRWF